MCQSHQNLAITTPLGDLKQVLQEVGLLLVEQFFPGGVHIRPDWLVSVEGTNVDLANLHTAQCYRYKSRQQEHFRNAELLFQADTLGSLPPC